MSSLVKQYNTLEEQRAVRMIDYNEKIEQKLAELARAQNGMEPEDGFQSLDALASPVIQANPGEVLKEAEEEAKLLLEDAKEQADALLEETRKQCEDLREQARAEGEETGYREGGERAREELEAEYQKKQEELEAYRKELTKDYNREMKELEPKLLDVIVEVVEKVFHIQFDDKKDILLHLVCSTMANIEGSHNFRIRVGEEQKHFLENHKNEILDRVGHDLTLEILSDAELEGNQCMIETETGIFDCSLGVQLENLIKDLRSLNA